MRNSTVGNHVNNWATKASWRYYRWVLCSNSNWNFPLVINMLDHIDIIYIMLLNYIIHIWFSLSSGVCQSYRCCGKHICSRSFNLNMFSRFRLMLYRVFLICSLVIIVTKFQITGGHWVNNKFYTVLSLCKFDVTELTAVLALVWPTL